MKAVVILLLSASFVCGEIWKASQTYDDIVNDIIDESMRDEDFVRDEQAKDNNVMINDNPKSEATNDQAAQNMMNDPSRADKERCMYLKKPKCEKLCFGPEPQKCVNNCFVVKIQGCKTIN